MTDLRIAYKNIKDEGMAVIARRKDLNSFDDKEVVVVHQNEDPVINWILNLEP